MSSKKETRRGTLVQAVFLPLVIFAATAAYSGEKCIASVSDNNTITLASTKIAKNDNNDSLINIVKNGALLQYPKISLGKAYAAFIGDLSWTTFTEDGNDFVIANGFITLYDELVEVSVAYAVDLKNKEFAFDSIFVEDEQMPIGFYSFLEYKIMDEYLYGSNTIDNLLITSVKNNYLFSYPDIPLGFALENLIQRPEWEAILGTDDNYYVNVYGSILYFEEDADALLQFLIDIEKDMFIFNAFEINGEPQAYETYVEMIEYIMDYISDALEW